MKQKYEIQPQNNLAETRCDERETSFSGSDNSGSAACPTSASDNAAQRPVNGLLPRLRIVRESFENQLKLPVRDQDYGGRTRPVTPTSNVPDLPPEEKSEHVRKMLTVLCSCIYAVFLVVFGGLVYISHQGHDRRSVRQIFSTCVSLIGMAWLIFLHVDLYRYKRKALKKMTDANEDLKDLNSSIALENASSVSEDQDEPPYRFLTGRHSGSFYLKAGLAAFCFGHLVNSGLQLGQEILYFVEKEKYSEKCGQVPAVLVESIRPIHSFYQLFIVFKYSNIVINRYKELARFALMHLVATCLCFWFGTIVQDAIEDFQHKVNRPELLINATNYSNSLQSEETRNKTCSYNTFLSINNLQAIPHLYPFTVEFNILLAGVWFIVWLNIGKDHEHANPHHFQHKIHNDRGTEEVTFQSNLVINADCHASNKGLFCGMFLLLSAIVTVIVFFVAMSSEDHIRIGVLVHTVQEYTLVLTSLIAVIFAWYQISKLDINFHPITFLDDVLLFIPLPFHFVYTVLTVAAEVEQKNPTRMAISVLWVIQTIIQTPFISDGLRRCSNNQALKYEKPGREIITFLIVVNLTMWIINTFEAKSIEPHYGPRAQYGEVMWMFINHTTLPLMLFYRFHSSVCLADIWKSAYAKGE